MEIFGFEIRVVLRDKKNIQALARAIPPNVTNDGEQRTDVLFLWEKFDKKETLGLIEKTKGVDVLQYRKGAIVWNLKRANYNKSKMKKFIGTVVYKHMTARNVNTVRKLAELME